MTGSYKAAAAAAAAAAAKNTMFSHKGVLINVTNSPVFHVLRSSVQLISLSVCIFSVSSVHCSVVCYSH